MGILTTYAIYKYGKRKAERSEDEELLSEVCTNCGYERRDHVNLVECPQN